MSVMFWDFIFLWIKCMMLPFIIFVFLFIIYIYIYDFKEIFKSIVGDDPFLPTQFLVWKSPPPNKTSSMQGECKKNIKIMKN